MSPRLAIAALCLVSTVALARELPSFADVKAAHHPSDVTLLDRHGVPVQTLRADRTVRRLAWVPLAELSPALLNAIVLSEDRRFYEHSGVDWGAAATSAWGNLWNTRTRGASTLTMQLAGLLDDELARPAAGRSLGQKLGQVVAARRLEAQWKKSEILEAYLNRVNWRGEITGIGALSQTLFGKFPGGLDAQEAAVAAALLRGPNAAPATVAQRACGVLTLQQLPCAGVTALAELALARRGGMPLGEQLAPHFARQLLALAPASGDTLRSTLDAGLQRVALDALRVQMAELAGRQVEDGAVLVLDNASGEVRAWVGSSGHYSDAPQVDGVLARRQPGSTLKPFVYALAFEQRLITPATLIDDAPTQIATRSGLYLPQNYDREFKGWVSARAALGASLNVPAVRVAAMLGPDALFERLNAFGLALPESGGYYGHALALGGADVTLLALTNAYRTLANGGLYAPVRLTDPRAALRPVMEPAVVRRVADAAAVHLVSDILSDNNARALTFGLDSALATRGFAAVKTGTSKDLRDNWCIGYTERYTVGVWVGNASGEPMHQVSGVSGAAPVWQAMVRQLHEGAPSRRPPRPPGVVSVPLHFETGHEPARDELFIAGTEPAPRPAGAQASAGTGQAGGFGILNPRDGSVFALDPDIPPAAQRIRFEGEPGTWVLDGHRLGSGARWQWAPWPGRHELRLLDRDGRALQTVRFEVRGAGVKTAQASR
ncbi:penicillin-binding protein 1C [Methylibium sp.]|uniref:penicillin-binding protein 1C n=1 Tax=Methylibium sp. TaxID=2067992 RepID=UPI003D0F282A